MKIAILADGTRGDIWPLVALGAQMHNRGYELAITATEEGQALLNRGWFPMMRRLQRLFHAHREGIEDASLRPGLPTMVCSVWADQPFWGRGIGGGAARRG